MKLFKITDLSNTKIISILESEFSKIDDTNIIENYHPVYHKSAGNIFFILNAGRYAQGSYFVLLDDNGEFACSAGWNHYTDDTALLLTRAYVSPRYRTKYLMAEYFLNQMLDDSKSYANRWITVNNYNISMYKWWQRSVEGKRPALFNNWPDIYKLFVPLGEKTVNNTLQFVVEYKGPN